LEPDRLDESTIHINRRTVISMDELRILFALAVFLVSGGLDNRSGFPSYYVGRAMRSLIAIFIVLAAFPVSADDGFTLGLAEMDFAAGETQEMAAGISALAADELPAERAEVLAFQASLGHTTGAERTQALWNSEMGRLYYAMAAQQAMLGREGLVNGGRMAGVGLGTAGIGDGDPNGALGMALGRGRWVEMNANQKLQAGVEATILGALLAFMISNAD